ncbi:MAG: hypothetical protein M3Z21_11435 [Pseudomonadota bacterium]|nr:hypothetical protein [Pseudomonadota bacterium]
MFIGIDGGATKTVARLEDAAGRCLGQGRGGPANIRLSVEDSWRSVRAAVDEALAQAGLDLNDGRHDYCCGAGLAGTEVAAARRAFLATPHPFARLVLKSDAYIACLGAHGGGDGAVIVIGTGVVGYQIEAGREQQVDGWGFPHADEGSGAWLGLHAVRLTLHWLDGRRGASPLLAAVLDRCGGDRQALVAWASQATPTRFAQLAPLVIRHAAEGTPLARALLRQAAARIDKIGAALAARSSDRALPCCLLGGLAPFVEPWLGRALRARLRPCQADAVHGAVQLIRRELIR